MVVTSVDQGLERLLRATLPLPTTLGDVSFELPDRDWGATLNRVTVNLFLFDVRRSVQPSRPMPERVSDKGRVERRPALPMVRLSYLASAWAGNVADEHQLLADVLGCLLLHQTLPEEHLPTPLPSPVQLSAAAHDSPGVAQLWNHLGGRVKPGAVLEATVAFDVGEYAETGPRVERVETLLTRNRPSAVDARVAVAAPDRG